VIHLNIVSALFALQTVADQPPPPAHLTKGRDCGAIALFVLLHLEGRTLAFKSYERGLPPPPADGYSMKEIADIAARFGLRLVGGRLLADVSGLSGPCIVFLSQRPHGHYIVVQPVGHTGKLLQVFDGFQAPVVIDADRLYRSQQWTGLVLLPNKESNYSQLVAFMIGISGTSLVVTLLLLFVRRTQRPVPEL
jgi:ABC-type bacteriocin/lantibiotic exporter with double-glycine peptidase domain